MKPRLLAFSCSRGTAFGRRAALAIALLVCPAAVHAATGDADLHFKHGVELYKDNDFSAALVEFQRAYELDPKYQVLYNVAESYFALQDYANALKTFQKYLYDGGSNIGARRRKDVERDIDKLRRRVAVLTVETNVPGAAIAVDDAPVGKTPLAEPVLVSAGRRRITATVEGRPPVTQVIEVAGGDAPTVAISIAGPEVKVVTLERPSIVPAAVAWGATGVVLTATIVTGVLALEASGDVKTQLAAFPGNPSAISADHAKTHALALATDVLGVITAAGAGVAIYLTVRTSRAAPQQTSARFVLSPRAFGVAGSF